MLDVIRSHFRIIPLDDAVTAMKAGKLPPRSACLTFDDGYSSWMEGVVPLLQRENLHGTFYITTGQFHNLPMWHERLAQAVNVLPGPSFHIAGFGLPPLPISTMDERRSAYALLEHFLKYQPLESRETLLRLLEQCAQVQPSGIKGMRVDQLRELSAKGFGIGAHTHSHPILGLCEATIARNEIGQVRETLEGMIRGKVRSFAYPNGRPMSDFVASHVDMVKAAGYHHAVTTHWGAASVETSVFEIPRFTPWGPTAQRMALQLARNLNTRPKLIGHIPPKAPVVLVAENGAGFGGAVVALKTLVHAVAPEKASFHIVANMPLGTYEDTPSVRSCRVIPDRIWDTRPLAQRIKNSRLGPAKRPMHFMLGRIDDLLNRVPYLIRLTIHALTIKPDVIHGNNEPNSNREAMLVAKLLRIHYVQHLRGELAPTQHLPWILGIPTAFIPVSRWLAGELLIKNVPSDRIRHIYDGIDLTPVTEQESISVEDIRSRLGLCKDTLIVAMIGMFVPWKGQDLFIDAVTRIQAKAKNTCFLLIGDTPERGDVAYGSSLKMKVASLNLSESVHFLGKLQNLKFFLPQFDIVVSASTQPEPLGLVMLEALAAGKTFVGPAFGAATEVINDGQNGFLFEPRSCDSLALKLSEALISIDSNPLPVLHSTSLELFSPIQCAEQTLQVYEMSK